MNNIFFKFKNRLIISLCFFSGLFMTVSCSDKEIDMPSEKEPGVNEEFKFDGYSIGFNVALDIDPETRAYATEEIDNYVDTKNKFRILFFSANGDFLFEAIDRTVAPLEDKNNKKNWFVHIPLNYVVDRKGNLFDAELIRNTLRTQNFKIAILANWSNGNLVEDTIIETDDNGGSTERPDPHYVKGLPDWGYYNSALCSDEDKLKSEYSLKNINDLHHLQDLSGYGGDNADIYGMITESGNSNMGVRTSWVSNSYNGSQYDLDPSFTINSAEAAETYIRDNWDPAQAGNKEYLTHYVYLWYVWNFAEAYHANNARFSDNNKWGEGWIAKNHGPGKPLYVYAHAVNGNKEKQKLVDNTDDANLTIDNSTFSTPPTLERPLGDNTYALRLYNQNRDRLTTSIPQTDKASAYGIKITIPSSGTLRVKFGAKDGAQTKLSYFNKETGEAVTIADTQMAQKDQKVSIKITEDPEDIYLYCEKGDAADIFEIEFIRDQYLYDTYRFAVEPTEDNPIPMYGVQNFNAIPESLWKEGTSFNISDNSTGYTSSNTISLIRSVSRIDVYLPKKNGVEPQHVMMRSVNRNAFNEPIDVETPIDIKWNDDHGYQWNGNVNLRCEWYNIRQVGRGYKYNYTNGQSTDNQKTYYKRWLSWFYGSWASAKWFKPRNGTNYTGWTFPTGMPINQSNLPYPKIFNPCIVRSDFARMIYKGQVGNYYRYVMYMPDKNIDDPNNVGITSSIPKVAHVEFRYESNANLDDNSCHRIYFTDYPDHDYYFQNIGKNDYETTFEQNTSGTIDGWLWPIMRNHRYSFTVGGTRADGSFYVQSSFTNWDGTAPK